jgi:quinoprotein dehydrogenase-associated probable ABC transporter substrate-binding protein
MAKLAGFRFLTCAAAFCAAAAMLAPIAQSARGQSAGGQGSPGVGVLQGGLELVDPKVLRVCADPNNLPFSNTKSEGFENKLADLFAAKLGKKIAYTFYPQATGFVRETLSSYRCDVIMGFPQGDELVQGTNPYYRSVYALVVKADSPLTSVDTLADPRLKGKQIGIVAGTPPATYLVNYGLMAKVKSYQLVVDTRYNSSTVAMIKDIESGVIDAGVLWGPIAGYYASRANPPMHVALLLKEKGGPRLDYRITMGVRPSDQNWKRQLNQLIAANQTAIDKILLDYNVPILDEQDKPITAASLAQKP